MRLMNSNSSRSKLDAKDLSAADGLLILLTRALDRLAAGETLEILSDNASAQHDLPAWTRLMGHEFLGVTPDDGRWCYRIQKGAILRVLTNRELDWGNRAPIQDGR